MPIPTPPATPTPVLVAWSGGKDSALALRAARADPALRVTALLTTVTEDHDRISMHGVRRSLLHAQARSIGLPLVEVMIPAECPNQVYEERMAAALVEQVAERAITGVVFGDLFLPDIRAYREARMRPVGLACHFPLWQSDTARLARAFIDDGFRAILCVVDPAQLDPAFTGRDFDHALLDDLPETVDPCGENGEFHTFVRDGPVFDQPVPVHRGEAMERDGFWFQELLEA